MRRGLALDPEQRFESMDALAEALTRVLALPERRRTRRWVIMAGVMASLSTGALAKIAAHFG